MQWESGRTQRTLLQVISESKAKCSQHQAFFECIFSEYGMEQKKATGTASSSLYLISPHSGQSSQLVFEANGRVARFLLNLANAVAWHTRYKGFKES
jgi:hypothetical protein